MQLEVTCLTASPSNSALPAPAQYQALTLRQAIPRRPISPAQLESFSLPSALDLNREVVLDGSFPNWVYGRLVSLCLRAPWIGCFNAPAGGIVVIHSRTSTPAVGSLIPIQFNSTPCPAILIGGPPNSGKSVFSNALRIQLLKALPHRKTYLHRASWDGEGNWAYEARTPMVDNFIRHNEFRIHEDPETAKLIPEYYQHHAKVVQNLRMLSDYVLVDVGGSPQKEKLPLIQQCTHYIVISRLVEAVEDWHQRCNSYITPIAVVHSVLENIQQIKQTSPYLEIVAGPWTSSNVVDFPECVLETTIKATRDLL